MTTLARVALTLAVLAGTTSRADASASREPRAPEPRLRRFALVASSNDGGRDRVRLRFANTDGRAMADVLRQLGGVREDDLVVVPDATPASLRASVERLRSAIATTPRRNPRREIFIYYSGHSDEEGLLLGGERVTYAEVRRWIDTMDADVRIAILDSCASGAVIRRRGGTRQPSFLGDISVDARGHAFLTASSASEAAQESDRIGAGFFTHYLVSGLRGAADTSRDGLITLGEAYQFAYQETLHRTERNAAGAQRPAYDIQLAGTGDLVLTDLRSTSAGLVLEEDLGGRVHVRDAGGRLVVEFQKGASHAVQLGLGAGRYVLLLDADDGIWETEILLEEGKTARVGKARFAPTKPRLATARGAGDAGAAGSKDPPEAVPTFTREKLRYGGYGGLAFRYARLDGRDALLAGAEFALLLNHRLAVGLAGYGSADTDAGDDELTFGYGGPFVRYSFLSRSPFYVSVGALAAAGAIASKPAGGTETQDTVFVFEPQVGGHLNVTRWMRVGVDVGYRLVAGIDDYGASGFRGVTAGFHVQLGWF